MDKLGGKAADLIILALLLSACGKLPDCQVGIQGDDVESQYAVQCKVTVARW